MVVMSVAIGQEDGAELSRGVAIETHVGKLHKYKMYLISYVGASAAKCDAL